MQIDFLIIADAAQATGGKLYMLGGLWTEYRSAVYPSNTRAAFVIGLIVSPEDRGTKQGIKITVTEAATKRMVIPEIRGELNVKPIAAGAPHSRFSIIVNANFQIPANGQYVIQASLDGHPDSVRQTEFMATMAPVEAGTPPSTIPDPSSEARH